jgi:putative ABC transport system substrate-binding protein
MMKRREFITLLAGTAAWPLAARAQQQPAMPVIGLLSSRSPAVDTPLIVLIRQGLGESGLVEGQNIAFDYRCAEGQGTDPIKSGLAASLRRPDGNLTGVSTFIAEMDSKRLGLLRELRPHATTTAFLVNPKYFQAQIQVSDIQTAAQSVGQDINVLNAGTIRDIDAAFTTLAQMRADALLVATDAFFFTRVTQFVVLSARHAIPTLYSRREFPAAGGLMSYGPNQDDSYRLLGVYAARILKGEKPGDLPIQLPTKFELVINLSTANALGLEIPATLLARADEVIE